MADDLMTNLRAAGDLLDERSEGALAETDVDGARILPLAPAIPSRGRRGQAVLASAAAVVSVMALVAAVSWNRGDEPLGVASAGQIAALVPSAGIGDWTHVEAHVDDTSVPASPSTSISNDDDYRVAGAILVAPDDASEPDRMARSMRIVLLPARDVAPVLDGAEEVNGSGLEAHVSRDTGTGALFMLTSVPGAGDTDYVIEVSAGPDASTDVMLAVAALVDVSIPIEEQTLDGWEILGKVNGSRAGGVMRTVAGERPGGEGLWLGVSTVTRAPDEVIWWLTEPYLSEATEVRGNSAWMLIQGRTITLTWVEAPGVVVQLTYGPTGSTPEAALPTDDELVAEALAAAEDLVSVDQAGWDEFAAQATEGTDGNMTETTTMNSTTTTVIVSEGMSEAGINGSTETGPYWVYTDGTGALCLELREFGIGECSDSGGAGAPTFVVREGRRPDTGEAVVIYGIAPEGTADAQARFTSDDGEVVSTAATRKGLWAAAVPVGHTPAEIAFFDADGAELARHTFEDRAAGR